jgi:hypothetical protein
MDICSISEPTPWCDIETSCIPFHLGPNFDFRLGQTHKEIFYLK